MCPTIADVCELTLDSLTIRTGCSSSLIGLHEACQAIYNGECTSAIVGGTNLIITPTMTVAMTEQGVLSPTGSCKSFDAKADGYARGEAINAVYIKKLSDAVRDGDPIRAVIRATATNCDGKTPGMACPSSESHESMIRRAYQVAQLREFSQTAFVECHGTGTAIGDPLETTAIANVFGHKGVFIGSVFISKYHCYLPSWLKHRRLNQTLAIQKAPPARQALSKQYWHWSIRLFHRISTFPNLIQRVSSPRFKLFVYYLLIRCMYSSIREGAGAAPTHTVARGSPRKSQRKLLRDWWGKRSCKFLMNIERSFLSGQGCRRFCRIIWHGAFCPKKSLLHRSTPSSACIFCKQPRLSSQDRSGLSTNSCIQPVLFGRPGAYPRS